MEQIPPRKNKIEEKNTELPIEEISNAIEEQFAEMSGEKTEGNLQKPEEWLGKFTEEDLQKLAEKPKEVAKVQPLEKSEIEMQKDAEFLKNHIESYVKQYAKDLNDEKWIKTIGEDRMNRMASFIRAEYFDNFILKREIKEAERILTILKNSLGPVAKEVVKRALQGRFAEEFTNSH